MVEFNLSEEIFGNDEDVMEEYNLEEDEKYWLYAKDVKEAIRRLKKELGKSPYTNNDLEVERIINKIFGKKLAHSPCKKVGTASGKLLETRKKAGEGKNDDKPVELDNHADIKTHSFGDTRVHEVTEEGDKTPSHTSEKKGERLK